MSHYDAERLYSLLPAVYRQRDAEQGHPLKALVAILSREAQVMESDLEGLYENAFIETCNDWVVPYIGDLVGVRPLPAGDLRRDEVANTLALRRRKGTAAVLEQVAADVTGWPARVVETFQHLATTQFVDHVRPGAHRTPDLRDAARLERLGGAFDDAPRSVDVRRAPSGQGRHNLGQIALWVWRLRAYPIHRGTPAPVDPGVGVGGRFTFHPLGIDNPLFQHPRSESGTDQLAGEENVPEPIRRRQLAQDLREGTGRFRGGAASFELYERTISADGGSEWRPLDAPIVCCDLTQWERPLPAQDIVAVDPELGRFVVGSGLAPAELRVSCHLGGGADARGRGLGGGPYKRNLEAAEVRAAVQVADPDDPSLAPDPEVPQYDTLTDALLALGSDWAGQTRVVEILDNRTYTETLLPITLPTGGRLVIRAADQQRPLLRLTQAFQVQAEAGSSLALDGLWVAGAGVEIAGELDALTLRHSTLVPGHDVPPVGGRGAAPAPSLILDSDAAEVEVSHSILGPLWAAPEAEVHISDSIVDAEAADQVAWADADGSGFGAALHASRVTVVGTVEARAVPLVENSLLLGAATAERRQEGCVRYSWIAAGSRVPRRFRCHPDVPAATPPAERERLTARVTPRFVTLHYGRPAYGQLDARGPAEILRGAEDGTEMGAFSTVDQAHRLDNLRQRLNEYLPVGLEAGTFLAS